MTTNTSISRPPKWRPLRIAVIGGRGIPSSYSGVERICEDLFAWFAEQGHHVTIYCRPSVLDKPRSELRGMHLVRTPAPGGKNGETLSHSLASLAHAMAFGDTSGGRRPFDIVSMHTIAPCLFLPLAKLRRTPVIAHVHGLDHQREKWRGLGAKIIHAAERIMVRTADHVAVVNPGLIDYYRQEYRIAASLVPNGITLVDDAFVPDIATLTRFGLQPKKYVVCVCRIVPEKRLQDVIAAWATLETNTKLVFVGEGKYSREYEQSVKALAARDPGGRIVFTGHQAGVALETLYSSAYLYVSASELEGMPSAVLECMERRVVPVLSDIDPHRYLYAHLPDYNLCFRTGNVGGLAERLRYALDHPDHVHELGERSRVHVRHNYAWSKLAAETEKMYLRIADRRPTPLEPISHNNSGQTAAIQQAFKPTRRPLRIATRRSVARA